MSVKEHFEIAGEIICEGWRDYKASFLKASAIAIATMAPFGLAGALIGDRFKASPMIGGLAILALSLFSLPFSALESAALYRLFDMKRKGDPEAGIVKAFRIGWKRFFMVLLTLLLLSAAFAIVYLLCLLPLFGAMALGFLGALKGFAGLLLLAGLVLSLPLELCALSFLGVKVSLSLAICLFEGWGPLRSVIRSFVITAGSFWILLMAFGAAWLACYAVYLPFGLASAWIPGVAGYFIKVMAFIVGSTSFAIVNAIAYRSFVRLSGEE